MTTAGTHDELTANGSSRRRAAARANAPDDLDGSPDRPAALGRVRARASAASEAIPGAVTRLRGTMGTVAERLPDAMATARTTALETADSFRGMPEPTRRSVSALSIGLGIGLSLAGAPRLVTMAALTPALLAAVVMTMDESPSSMSASSMSPSSMAGGRSSLDA